MLTIEQLEQKLIEINYSINQKKSLRGKSNNSERNHSKLFDYLTDPVAIALLNQNISQWQTYRQTKSNELIELTNQKTEIEHQISQLRDRRNIIR